MRDGGRHVRGPGRLAGPFDIGFGEGGRVRRAQEGVLRQQAARLLPGGDHQRRLVAIRGEDIAQRMPDAGRRMQVAEGSAAAGPGIAIGHRHDAGFLQPQHVAEIVRPAVEEAELGRAGIAEDGGHAAIPQQRHGGLPHRDRPCHGVPLRPGYACSAKPGRPARRWPTGAVSVLVYGLTSRYINMPDTALAPRPRLRDPDQTRRNILDAALAEFADKGLSGARVDEIAARTAHHQADDLLLLRQQGRPLCRRAGGDVRRHPRRRAGAGAGQPGAGSGDAAAGGDDLRLPRGASGIRPHGGGGEHPQRAAPAAGALRRRAQRRGDPHAARAARPRRASGGVPRPGRCHRPAHADQQLLLLPRLQPPHLAGDLPPRPDGAGACRGAPRR